MAARDEVWGGYRYVVLTDDKEENASSAESLCRRINAALKSGAVLNESVGAGYLERNWPPLDPS